MLACIALIGLVITARRRAWWLIGLAPVLALFAHRFTAGDVGRFQIAEEPTFVAADDAKFVGDDDYVVGVTIGDEAFAYPYAALYWTPVVVQTDGERRVLLIWCAYANSAVATTVSRDIKPRELDIVCEPANALLLYNSRIGQFVNGFTGRTPGGGKPLGFGMRLPIWKGPWKNWKAGHPQTIVMAPTGKPGGPAVPVLPREPVISTSDHSAQTRVIVIATAQSAALATSDVGTYPVNVKSGDVPVLVFRDPATASLRAFDRHVEADLAPRFILNRDARRKGYLVDIDTNTTWSTAGVAQDGEKDRLGKKLTPVEVQDDVYWGVAKFWWPQLQWVKPDTQADARTGVISATQPGQHSAPARKKRRR